ncbi:MAG: helix-turn-helix domain-containing protein [Candidatus Heimdallarchaeota archaeon]|nr:helix-turn-helix domain-containing protein [Candidatus Heimdallarchaeota archaeon]
MDRLQKLIEGNRIKLERIIELLEGSRTPWLSSKEAANYLRCSSSKLEDLTTSGLIPFRRLDPRSPRSPRLFHRWDLDAYLVAGRNPHSSPLSASERRQLKELA